MLSTDRPARGDIRLVRDGANESRPGVLLAGPFEAQNGIAEWVVAPLTTRAPNTPDEQAVRSHSQMTVLLWAAQPLREHAIGVLVASIAANELETLIDALLEVEEGRVQLHLTASDEASRARELEWWTSVALAGLTAPTNLGAEFYLLYFTAWPEPQTLIPTADLNILMPIEHHQLEALTYRRTVQWLPAARSAALGVAGYGAWNSLVHMVPCTATVKSRTEGTVGVVRKLAAGGSR